MLEPQIIPGGWYVDSLPSGEFAAVMPRLGLRTHLGDFWLPDAVRDRIAKGEVNIFGPRFLRLAPNGQKAAGQCDWQPGAVECDLVSGEWRILPPEPLGNSPVIYDLNNQLVISQGGAVGSQGYRFVDQSGRLWTGDETLLDPTAELSEWTDCSGRFRVGQAHAGPEGCIVLIDGVRRMLHPGRVDFIRAHCDGMQFAISCVAGPSAVIYRERLAELRTLPEARLDAPIPTPTPEPEPVGDPDFPDIPNMLPTVQRVATQHPDLIDSNSRESIGQFTEFAAAALHDADPRWGLVAKPGGQTGYHGHGVDSIKDRVTGAVVDIVANAESGQNPPASPAWQQTPLRNNRADNVWMAPVPVDDEPDDPEPDPDPTPTPGPDLGGILTRLDQLEAQAALAQATADEAHANLADLTDRVTALGQQKLRVVVRDAQGNVTDKLTTTSKAYHNHDLFLRSLTVEKVE